MVPRAISRQLDMDYLCSLPTHKLARAACSCSFTYRKGWHVRFFEADRHRRQLPRLAFFLSDEAMIEFTRRAGGPKTLEDRNIFEMMIRRSFGEITLDLSENQYAMLKQPRRANPLPKKPSTSVRDERNEDKRKFQ